MNLVRSAIEKPDNITQSGVLARSEVGNAIAQKIREAHSSELSDIAENVLPQLEKFLESPEEKRLRRIRAGTIVGSVGLGITVAFSVISVIMENDFAFFASLGFVTFFIGLSLLANGLLFTVPKKAVSENSLEADRQRELDKFVNGQNTNDLLLESDHSAPLISVVEDTTRQLRQDKKKSENA